MRTRLSPFRCIYQIFKKCGFKFDTECRFYRSFTNLMFPSIIPIDARVLPSGFWCQPDFHFSSSCTVDHNPLEPPEPAEVADAQMPPQYKFRSWEKLEFWLCHRAGAEQKDLPAQQEEVSSSLLTKLSVCLMPKPEAGKALWQQVMQKTASALTKTNTNWMHSQTRGQWTVWSDSAFA